MKTDQIDISINTAALTIEELTVRDSKEEGKRVQFILKNNSNAKFELKSMELKLFDKNKSYIGHELCYTNQIDDFILKKQELLLEFGTIELDGIESAELKIVAVRWFKLSKLLLAIAVIVTVLVMFAVKK